MIVAAALYMVISLNFDKIKFTTSMVNLYSKEKNTEHITQDNNTDENVVLHNPLQSIINDANNEVNEDNEMESQDAIGSEGAMKSEDVIESKDVTKSKDVVKSEDVIESEVEDKHQEKKADKKDNNKVTIPKDNKPKDKSTTPTPPTSKPQTDSKRSYISIVNDYNSKFESLRSNFEGDLDNLLAQGAADYSSGNSSVEKLAVTYMSSGAKLEKSSDVKFKAVLKDMEKDLKTNGHDTAIVKEIDSYYTNFKKSKKSALISKGMAQLN